MNSLDWIQDSLHERGKRPKSTSKLSAFTEHMDNLDGTVGRLWRLASQALEEGQSWVIVTLVGESKLQLPGANELNWQGVAIGISAAIISIITVWLSDMKMGYCTTGWWLSQKFCCLEVAVSGEGCAEWRNWGGVEPFRWIAYMAFAVRFKGKVTSC